MSKVQQAAARLFWLYSPVVVGVLVMLPRLLSPHFGLFDDGLMLGRAQLLSQGNWALGEDYAAGRFRPVYWLYYALLYRLFGSQPLGFFLGNTLLLGLITASLIALARRAGGSRLQAWAAGLLFVLSGPVVENFYTLSKGEPLQLAWLCLAGWAVLSPKRLQTRQQKLVSLAAATLAVTAAASCKETTLALAPISLAWLFIAWWSERQEVHRPAVLSSGMFCAASWLGSLGFILLRMTVMPQGLTGGSYTNDYVLEGGRILAGAFRWLLWLGRDFAYLLPLGGVALAILPGRRGPARSVGVGFGLAALVWMAAWLGIYLPWSFAPEYYLLPFAAGAAWLGGMLIAQGKRNLANASAIPRRATAICLGLAAILFAMTLPVNLSTARLQLAMDAVNARMLDYLAQKADPGSTVLVNIQYFNETVREIRLHLHNVRGRQDITVETFKFQKVNPGENTNPETIYIISPEVTNQPLLTVRMGVVEPTQAHWNKTLQDFFEPGWEEIFADGQGFRLFGVDLARLFCPLASSTEYCSRPAPLVDRRMFWYGWRVYRAPR